MKNTIKMSLAAAVAVTAFSTTASAGNLEDMIKGVSVSGQMQIDYQADSNDRINNVVGQSSNQVEYDFDFTVKAPVNEYITATVGFQADHQTTVEGAGNTRANANTDTSDTQLDMTLLNFTYANGPVTAIVGKQTVATPFTFDQKGDGVVALYNVGPVTLAAAHFVNTNVDLADKATVHHDLVLAPATVAYAQSTESISGMAVIAPNIADTGINASAWYIVSSGPQSAALNVDGAEAYTLNVNAKIADMVNVDVRHSSAELQGTGNYDAEELSKIVVGANLDMVSLTAGYATTNDTLTRNGGRIHGVSFDDDDTTATGFNGTQLFVDALNDADAFLIGASATFGKFGAGVTYIDGEATPAIGTTDDFSELILNGSYAMSKNFNITANYSMAEVDRSTVAANIYENDRLELAMEYKF